ncbi:MAG: SpoIIE family protein phosphatase [Kofleriaceae bacterium]
MTEAIEIGHESDVGAVRRRFVAVAQAAGFDEGRANDAATVASELASNVFKHAKHGGAIVGRDEGGISIVVWDRGPGMDVNASIKDGVSTAGTSGNGLGAVTRLATSWDAYAPPGAGSIVAARFAKATTSPLSVGAVSLPYPGLDVCGDAIAYECAGSVATLFVVDGLGHGEGAQEAAAAAVSAFRAGAFDAPRTIIERAHRATRPTRGAAATCVRLDFSARTAIVCGVGNVAAFILGDRDRQLVTQHGTLGQTSPQLREETYPFPAGAILVMASDGIKSRWSITDYPGLVSRTPLVIATALWRELQRGRDDVTVLVVKERR